MKMKMLGIIGLLLLFGGCAASRYSTAEKYLEKKQYDQAIRAYLRLLDPHMRSGKRFIYYDREAITGIGLVYWHMHRFETAARILDTVVEKEPDFGKSLFYLGMSYEGMGREEDALKVYRKYPSVSSNDPYRKVLIGRMDYFVRREIAREIQAAIKNEEGLSTVQPSEKSVAVLYFLSLSNDPQWKPLQKGLADMMITDLSQIEDLHVIERLRLQYLMEELNLSVTGLIDENTAPRAGKLMSAGTLIKGSYMVMPDMRLTLDANIFRIGMISAPIHSNYEGNLAHLFRMEKELVLKILDQFDIELTPEQRRLILRIPTENMMAFLNYCRGLDAMDRYDFNAAQDYFEKAVRLDPNFVEARDLITTASLWDATHKVNYVRVRQEVAQLIKTVPGRVVLQAGEQQPLVTTWNRLLRMGRFQNAGFLPGNDSREAFQEADANGSLVLPEELGIGGPPLPPGR